VVIEAFDRMMAMGVQFILLGIGDPRLEKNLYGINAEISRTGFSQDRIQ